MDADDERQPAAFKVMKSAMEAAELRAGLEGLDGRIEIVVSMRIKPGSEGEEKPDGGISSLSTLDPDDHLKVLMETTQQFARQTGYPLEMMVLQKNEQEQG